MNPEIFHINNLTIGYSQPIVENISAKVRKGELVGLVGRNGSGKTTLLKTLIGIQPAIKGEVKIHEENILNWDITKRAKEMAVVFSRLDQVPPISVQELVALGRLPYGNGFSKLKKEEKDLIENSLELVGITSLQTKMANQLSDGQLQMVMIARALVQETDLILMDEPTSHLDIENQFKIIELIDKLANETGKTFIIASHQIELILQNATQLWWMDKGEFHAGFPEQIAYEQAIFEKLSQKSIRFNYQTGNFQFQNQKIRKIGFEENGTPLSYWIRKALERNGFEIEQNSPDRIYLEGNLIRRNNHTFESIEKLIDYLIQN